MPKYFFVLDTFEEHWSCTLQNIPQFGFLWGFLMMRMKLWHFSKHTTEVTCPREKSWYHIRSTQCSYVSLLEFNLDHFVKEISACFLHYKLMFPFVFIWGVIIYICDGYFYVSTQLAMGDQIQHYFWMCLWWYFQMRLPFALMDWVKQVVFSNVGGYHSIYWGLE